MLSALLWGVALGQTPPPTKAPPAPVAAPPADFHLSEVERLKLENFQLKLKTLQQEIQTQYNQFVEQLNDYERETLAAHPKEKGEMQLNRATLTWQRKDQSSNAQSSKK